MTILKFKCVAIISGVVLLISSCTKNKPPKEEKDTPVVKEPLKKVLLPIKLESGNLVINLKYNENSTLISEVKTSDGYRFKPTYKDELPSQYDKYANKTLIQSIYCIRVPNKDLKVTFFNIDGQAYSPTGSLVLKQNLQNQISSILASGSGHSYPYKESECHYSSSGNLSDITIKNSPTNNTSITYTYDEKNGIFKNVQHCQLLFLAINFQLFSADVNNRLSYSNTGTPGENTNFTYQYNADGYPTQFTITKSKQTFKITYIELQQ
ncbi:hypothetical protein [Pedobacter foliorum]|uniref:hypothetical protein n=1 Tax=Pedobacter foliorum TaxID=2739058 RepID=UPI001567AD41|nr:hypothetical protein [Pedobacter foliorum]NRF40261.1 hypothetical protein [Pedobacter foliorum]